MIQWNSLFCRLDTSNNPLDCLQQSLIQLEYELYSAFDLIPGKSYPDTLKTFIAPAQGAWTHILVSPETDIDDLELLAEMLSAYGLCLLTQLNQEGETIALFQEGEEIELESGLRSHLFEGKSVDDLRHALAGTMPLPMIEGDADEQSQILAIHDLPPEMRQMAQGLSPSKTQNMFQRFSRQLMGRGQAEQAQELFNEDKLDWNGSGGMKIRGLMSCLMAGDDWLSPDFMTVRDAYQRHIRMQRRPNAKLYPGDEAMMSAVPNALDYTPVYGGQV